MVPLDGSLVSFFATFLEQIATISPALLYPALAISAFAENLFPPLPGDLVVVFGGYLAQNGRISTFLVWGVVTAGSWGGFMTVYAFGHWMTGENRGTFLRTLLSQKPFQKAQVWLSHWGMWLVLCNRFLVGVRAFVSLAAALGGLSPLKVGFLALCSAALWNGLLLGTGFVIGVEWQKITGVLSGYNKVVWAGMALAAAIWLGKKWWQNKKGREAEG